MSSRPSATDGDRAIEDARAAGIDLQLIDANLALTPEERARQHDRALALVLEFDAARRKRDEQLGGSPSET